MSINDEDQSYYNKQCDQYDKCRTNEEQGELHVQRIKELMQKIDKLEIKLMQETAQFTISCIDKMRNGELK